MVIPNYISKECKGRDAVKGFSDGVSRGRDLRNDAPERISAFVSLHIPIDITEVMVPFDHREMFGPHVQR